MQNRASSLIERILQLEEDETARLLDDVLSRFAGRHHDLLRRLPAPLRPGQPPRTGRDRAVADGPDADRRLLQPRVLGRGGGAVQPVDGAAPGPDRPGARRAARGDQPAADRRGPHLLDRLRAPRSSDPARYPARGPRRAADDRPADRRQAPLEQLAAGAVPTRNMDNEASAYVLSALPERYDDEEFEDVIGHLPGELLARPTTQETLEAIRRIVATDYAVDLPGHRAAGPAGALAGHAGREQRHGGRPVRAGDRAGRAGRSTTPPTPRTTAGTSPAG